MFNFVFAIRLQDQLLVTNIYWEQAFKAEIHLYPNVLLHRSCRQDYVVTGIGKALCEP